ncbi:MAG: hypothetical protein PUH99_02855 [Firmicutes bacterium]|nr:hypothetical protein [Bacillota bacterium]MDY5530761.1 hypothetical protein [Pumilibacteraceae bacterium]
MESAESNKNQSGFSSILDLALETMKYTIVLIALVLIAFVALFPSAAESFYSFAGYKALAYKFAVNATNENSDISRVQKTADRALSLLSEKDLSQSDSRIYARGAEKYCAMLLTKSGVKEYYAELDRKTVERIKGNRILHIRFCDSIDYYTASLYNARLMSGKTEFFIRGEYVSLQDLARVVTEKELSEDERAYIVRQAALYVDYCVENGLSDGLKENGFFDFYDKNMLEAAKSIDSENPGLKKLFRISVYAGFAKEYKAAHPDSEAGKIEGIENFESIEALCDYCMEKYKENK